MWPMGNGHLSATGEMTGLSAQARSRIMASIKGRDTKPEMRLRRCLHAAGFRYRLHVSGPPGTPDIVFPSRRLAIFVHGCFWRRCPNRGDGAKTVKSNRRYWLAKLRRNRRRDKVHQAALRAAGWKPWIVWECETRVEPKLLALVEEINSMAPRFLGQGDPALTE